MSYREITLCLEQESSVKSLALVANMIGAGLHAYINGVHAIPRYEVPGLVLPQFPEQIQKQIRQKAQSTANDIRAEFERVMSQGDTNWQWVQTESKNLSEYQSYLDYALHSDVVITTQPVAGMPESALQRELLVNVGTPLIVVPTNKVIETVGKRVAVAWNATAESARAVRDAMPLLTSADEVQIISVGMASDRGSDVDPKKATLQKYLDHHNVTSTYHEIEGKFFNISLNLLEHVMANNVDLLVMGGFGHSRLYDVVVGAATGEVIRNMEVPVFLSH